MALPQRYLTLAALLLAWLLPAPAARSADAPAPPPPPSFRMLCLGTIESLLYSPAPGVERRLSLGTSAYSRPYPVPENGRVSFYRPGPPAKPDGPPTRIEVGEVRLGRLQPGEVRSVILIPGGLPGAPPPALASGAPAEFACVVLDDSRSAHPAGSVRVISFSRQPAAVRFGAEGAQIPPLQTKLLHYPPGDRAMLQIATFADDAWMPIASSLQMLAPDTRVTLFLTDQAPTPGNPRPTEILYRRVAEILPPAR